METTPHFLPANALEILFAALYRAGITRIIGPVAENGAIGFRELHSAQDLPRGLRDVQTPGHYRLRQEEGCSRRFAWANPPQALKPLTFAPRETLWHSQQDASGRLVFSLPDLPVPRTAILGVRACDLTALRLQEAHFLRAPHVDPFFSARRAALFLMAVHCSHPASTCFCASTGDGPVARSGFDLALTELEEGFLLAADSLAGEAVLADLRLASASTDQEAQALAQAEQAIRQQSRHLPQGLEDAPLQALLEHPHWETVGQRCLSCGNCTAVCPTCFCHVETEELSLDGTATTHLRQWDSCFTSGHAAMGSWQIRPATHLRYRQWLGHKLLFWPAQYGRSGCVGCGRCLTWCPVGIDLTVEIAALLDSPPAEAPTAPPAAYSSSFLPDPGAEQQDPGADPPTAMADPQTPGRPTQTPGGHTQTPGRLTQTSGTDCPPAAGVAK